VISLLRLDPTSYEPHGLHSSERLYPETNCYTDLWIELAHAYGFDPVPMLACCVAVDFEGDQWTFFKPPPADLERLYGMEVYELSYYRSLEDYCATQLELGRPVIVEVDGYSLPDTHGRSYRTTHEKTSIALEAIDPVRERLRYFHNAGYFELSGDDYRDVLRVGERAVTELPPYIEVVRRDRVEAAERGSERELAAELLAQHVGRLPTSNPVERFGQRLGTDLPALAEPEAFHAYAFATVRQCGAAWDSAATFLRWLDPELHRESADAFELLASTARTLMLKLARAATGRALDPTEQLEAMTRAWDDAAAALCVRA
jgi:uncharacterized protein DUF1839